MGVCVVGGDRGEVRWGGEVVGWWSGGVVGPWGGGMVGPWDRGMVGWWDGGAVEPWARGRNVHEHNPVGALEVGYCDCSEALLWREGGGGGRR